jgi:uncharacterized membrane protein YtjA (UPF0391 family)
MVREDFLPKGVFTMLSWALIFFFVALIAAVLGFWGLAGLAATVAKILFFAFLILVLISLTVRAMRGRTPPV